MNDRLDIFIAALERYFLMNDPADILAATQYAKAELDQHDELISLENSIKGQE